MRIGRTKEFNGFSLSFIVIVYTLSTLKMSTDSFIFVELKNRNKNIFFSRRQFFAKRLICARSISQVEVNHKRKYEKAPFTN